MKERLVVVGSSVIYSVCLTYKIGSTGLDAKRTYNDVAHPGELQKLQPPKMP